MNKVPGLFLKYHIGCAKRPKYMTTCNLIFRAYTETKNESRSSSVVQSNNKESASLQTSVKSIKTAVATASYTGVVIAGFGIAALVIYAIFSELFSSKSANTVYSKAFKYVSKDQRVINAIGDQIKGYGEESRRGRRQHISHALYEKDGVHRLRMKFYIKGTRGSGTVHLEMMENEKGKFIYRYLFVITDGIVQNMITLEDNRDKDNINKLNMSTPINLQELDLTEPVNFVK